MKKYVAFVILIGLILAGFLIYSILNVKEGRSQEFIYDGYILQASNKENVERYYFNQNEKYENKYNEKIIFKDTEGDKITTESNNFIHYTDGSISSFQNGVIMNLDDVEKEPILYYNIGKNKVLKKSGESFLITHLNGKLEFENFIWKISANKYLLYAKNMTIIFNDGSTKNIEGYIEIEYTDNEVVQLYNQEVTYKTIGSNLRIDIEPDITLNLDNKIVSKAGENKMSLLNMVIDSDENVEIIDLNDYEVTTNEENENTTNSENSQDTGNEGNGGAGSGGSSIITNNNSQGSTSIVDGNTNNNDGNTTNDNDNDNEQIVDGNSPTIQAPTFKIENFEVDAIGLIAKITIEDEEGLLTDNTTIQIIKNSTGKTVYEDEKPLGIYNIDLEVLTLEPNTQYTLKVQSTYQVDEINYTRNFIYKIFRTDVAGITLEKDLITENYIRLKIATDSYSKVNNLKIALYDEEGKQIGEENTVNTTGVEEAYVEFYNLTSNTNYIARIYDIQYDNKVVLANINMEKTFTTLKTKPVLSGTEFLIDKVTGKFTLKLNQIEDKDNGIVSYTYKILYADNIEEEQVVKQITINNYSEVDVMVDGTDILRNTPYVFKVVVLFNDNEKLIEYESEYSSVMKIDGIEFPTVSFEADPEDDAITFERIKGTLIVEDKQNAITVTQLNPFTITYTDSVGNVEKFTALVENENGEWRIPVNCNDLRKNETYKFSVYATIDLKDDNGPIDQCYIGGAIVQTEDTKELTANFLVDDEQVEDPFSILFQLKPTIQGERYIEAETLENLTFTLYAGRTVSGEPVATITKKGTGGELYESELKKEYYDETVEITPSFFGISKQEITEDNYTLQVTEAYDYTKWQNEVPIVNNTITFSSVAAIPDVPEDETQAIRVDAIRNNVSETPRDDLDASTIVAYRVSVINFDNSKLIAKKVIYQVYDATTDTLVATNEVEVDSTGEIKSTIFNLQDGTDINTVDNEFRRGNQYYFTYQIELDINRDGETDSVYPPNSSKGISSDPIGINKQEPSIILYEETSDGQSITYQYKCIDIDQALTENYIYLTQGDNRIERNILIGADNYNQVVFNGVTRGEYTISIDKNLVKYDEKVQEQLLTKSFDGTFNLSEVNYQVTIQDNALIRIDFSNTEALKEKIASLKIEFKPLDGSESIIKDFVVPEELNDNLSISINLYDIISLKGKTIEVKVFAYYDSGVVGFGAGDNYIAIEKYNTSTGSKNYYSMYGQELIEDTTIHNNIFQIEQVTETSTQKLINLRNVATNNTIENVPFDYSSAGFLYLGNQITAKQIKQEEITSSDNTIDFNDIIPGINLYNENQQLNIVRKLKEAQLSATLQQTDAIIDGKVYIELYKASEDLINSELIETIEKNVSDFENPIIINNLIPGQYYKIKFWTNITAADGSEQKVYLLDMNDTQYIVNGKEYIFRTLGEAEISNENIQYVANSYRDKKIRISYAINPVDGVSRMEYELYRIENDEEIKIMADIASPDTIITNAMTKEINIANIPEMPFGYNYKVVIKAISEYEDNGETQTMILDTSETLFELEEIAPIATITGSKEIKDDSYNIQYNLVTVYDEMKLIKDDVITISIQDDLGNDVTPEEYKQPIQDNFINKIISLTGMDRDRDYTLTLTMQLNPKNTADDSDLETITKTYTIKALGMYGVDLGDIYIQYDSNNASNIILLFYNTYAITEIDEIQYSIVNSTTGSYAYSNRLNFRPIQTLIGNDVVYQASLGLNRALESGLYEIQINFMKDGNLVEQRSLSFSYSG